MFTHWTDRLAAVYGTFCVVFGLIIMAWASGGLLAGLELPADFFATGIVVASTGYVMTLTALMFP